VELNSTMDNTYKSVKFKLSSWNKLRRAFYGRKNETFSDYIERIAKELKNESN
jgi:predicted RNA-binding protein with PIN domain